MQTVVGVRFKQAGKIYYFSPGRLELALDDPVIVETARGVEYGKVVVGPREMEDQAVPSPLSVVHRKATAEDAERVVENRERAKEAFGIGLQKIAAHGLPMKLVDVEYTFDLNKIIFYFTADGRVDFRELVKDLASVFRTRIELRQIGVRDEAKLVGGIGCCGRPLCCATFLGEFAPVSIRMAKEQNLSLNPAKISGVCGRLMCCLKYESGYACESCPRKKTVEEPKQGALVATAQGNGKVISVSQQRHSATILLTDGRTAIAAWEDVVEVTAEELEASTEPAAIGEELASALTAHTNHERRLARQRDTSSRESGNREPRESWERRPKRNRDYGEGRDRNKRKSRRPREVEKRARRDWEMEEREGRNERPASRQRQARAPKARRGEGEREPQE